MGSKYKVVPALLDILEGREFGTALDAFSGSGVVGYALKAMGKQVIANDFLRFSATIADATVANSSETLTPADLEPDHLVQRGRSGLHRTDIRGAVLPR